ncbi:MAG: AAA family ATPase [Tannerellaceae bacterium]|jgi:hypothetical protein|nr:AAA family ATPase [Tannerellaceae bacterium]
MKKLPIGIQSFSDLRSNDYLYVDKTEGLQTEVIYPLVTTGRIYFLSHAAPEEIKEEPVRYMRNIAGQYGLASDSHFPSGCFDELIKRLHDKTGKKAVILIDGRDKPAISHLFDSYLTEIKTTA